MLMLDQAHLQNLCMRVQIGNFFFPFPPFFITSSSCFLPLFAFFFFPLWEKGEVGRGRGGGQVTLEDKILGLYGLQLL